MIASAIVTYLITATAAWGYPQGAATIWPIGLVAMAFVIGSYFLAQEVRVKRPQRAARRRRAASAAVPQPAGGVVDGDSSSAQTPAPATASRGADH